MRFLITLIVFLIFPVISFASIVPDTIYAITPEHINNKNIRNNSFIELYVIEVGAFSSDLCLTEGDKIAIKITDYVKPKRGKRDGYFKIEYKNKFDVDMHGSMKISTPKDLKNMAKSAGVSVVGHILKVPGFSQAVAVSKGIIKPNENETRLKSAGKNLYESTPLTYAETGKDFNVETDGIVVLKLKESSSTTDEE